MNDKKSALAKRISEIEARFMEAKKHELNYLASIYLHELDGLKDAFAIVFDETYIEYFINQEGV